MRACADCGSTRCDDEWRCLDCGFAPSRIRGFLAFAPDLAHETTGFDAGHFDGLAGLEADSFWFLARNDLVAWAARTYFGPSMNVHEVGCGTGFVLGALRRALPAAELSGSEVLVAGLEFARGRAPETPLYQLDACRIPFRDEFDLIGAFDVLEHVDDDTKAIRQMHDALRPLGGLLVTVPQHPALWSAQDDRASHRRRYTAPGMAMKITQSGFEILRMTSFVSLLLPAMLLSRRLRSPAGAEEAVEALRAPGVLDRPLRTVMGAERRLIEMGFSFPAGGSLLVAARRVD